MFATENARIRAIAMITIERSRSDIYEYWRDFSNLPQFMRQVESVRVLDARRSEWLVRPRPTHTATWTAEIVEERPGARIAWQTWAEDDVDSLGSVTFREARWRDGVDVLLDVSYSSSDRRRTRALGRLFHHDPCREAFENLRALKHLLEAPPPAIGPCISPTRVLIGLNDYAVSEPAG